MKFSKILSSVVLVCAFVVSSNAKEVEIPSLNGKNEEIQAKVPFDPKRVAVLDYATLDTMDALGLGDRIVAIPKGTKLASAQRYYDDKKVANVGTAKEVDYEKLIATKPDLIFMNGRMAKEYDKLSKIAPVAFLNMDFTKGGMQAIKESALSVATIFGLEAKTEEILKNYQDRVNALSQKVAGKKAVLGLITSSSLHLIGNDRHGALIGRDIGFDNLAKDIKGAHGNESSFEILLKLDPEYIFVLDRDNAIGKAGAKLAAQVMDNELIKKINAFKNNKIFYLTPSVWYLSEGGLNAVDTMLKDIEKVMQ